MAITISQTDATLAIRAAAVADAIDPAVATVVGYLFKAASALIIEYAPGAPDDVHNMGLIRLLGWLYDSDPSDPSIGRAMAVSGASALLAPFRTHRAGAIGALDQQPAPGGDVPAGAGLPAYPAEGSFILTVNNGELAWVEFPLPS